MVSVDTRNAATMAAALDAGAAIVNDVSGLAHDPASAPLVAARDCPVVLMHMRGTPATMAGLARYGDVVAEVAAELSDRVTRRAESRGQAGADRARPRLRFRQAPAQSIALLHGLPRLCALGFPVLAGLSRKGVVGTLSGERDAGGARPGFHRGRTVGGGTRGVNPPCSRCRGDGAGAAGLARHRNGGIVADFVGNPWPGGLPRAMKGVEHAWPADACSARMESGAPPTRSR